MKCGLNGKKAKKPVKGKHERGKKGKGKGSNRRSPSTFAVCPNAQITFSPSVSN